MPKVTLIRLCGIAAIIAGALRAIATFVPTDASPFVLEPLYLCTDLFILFAVLGMYAHRHAEIGVLGFSGMLLAIAGILIIRSSHALPNMSLYPAGALILSVGLIALAASLYRVSALSIWPATLWATSLALGIVASLVAKPALPFIAAGLTFSIGLWMAGYAVRRSNS